MKFNSKVFLSRKDVEDILIDHLKAKNIANITKIGRVSFDIGTAYSHPMDEFGTHTLKEATIEVEIEV